VRRKIVVSTFDIGAAVSRALTVDRARLDRAVARAMDEGRSLTPDELETFTPEAPPAPEDIPAVKEDFFVDARTVLPPAMPPPVPALMDMPSFEGDYRRAWLAHILPPRHRGLAYLDQPTVKSDLTIEQVKCLFNYWLLVSLLRAIDAGTAPEPLRSVALKAAKAEVRAYEEIGRFKAALKRMPPAPAECPRCGYALPAMNGRLGGPQRP
jgi:hypothetical protein